MRRATSRAAVPAIFPSDFYPRSPCGERLRICRSIPPRRKISIHALLAESDVSERELQPQTWNFYPRSPCGERPCDNSTGFAYIEISIHALLAESDTIAGSDCSTFGISIHALLAESDPPNSLAFFLASSFLSTLSLRRATRHGRLGSAALHISIHALLAESDSFLQRDIHPWLRFLSTLSLRRATPIGYVTSHWFQFLSTLSLRRATTKDSTI